jgi:polyhydroxyalkanoate synthesis repressor PhaR
MVTIKRYSNRKLYNTATRSYITLEQLSEMVRRGEDIQVLEHPGSADLTASILAQVIVEQEKSGGGVLPNVLLTDLVQARDRTVRSVRQAVHAFLDPDAHVEEEISRRLKALADGNLLDPAQASHLASLLTDPRFRSPQPMETAAAEKDIHLVKELRRQVDELEKEINSLLGNPAQGE